jgi:hypothetical protein
VKRRERGYARGMQSPIELEHRGWDALKSGRARQFYDAVLTSDATFVVPGTVLGREETLASWDAAPPWRDVELSDERMLDVTEDVCIVTYAGRAWRDAGDPYDARFTTVYVYDGAEWRVAFHQQTPVPPRS